MSEHIEREKALATAVLYCAVNDYLKGKSLMSSHGGWGGFWAYWNALSRDEKVKYSHKTVTMGFYRSAKDFFWPPKDVQPLTDFWCHLAEISLNNIQRRLR